MFNNAKRLIALTVLLSFIDITYAATLTPVTVTPPTVPTAPNSVTSGPTPTAPIAATPTNTNAIGFAIQAGQIAGVAQACGQNTSIFAERVSEALRFLSTSNPDLILALETFQSSVTRAQAAQAAKNLIPCAQVIKDYNSLPILRDDYKQTVLPKLAPNIGDNPDVPAPNNSIKTPQPSGIQINSGYAQPLQSLQSDPPQPSVIQQNAGYPPSGANTPSTAPTTIPPSGGYNPVTPPTQQYGAAVPAPQQQAYVQGNASSQPTLITP